MLGGAPTPFPASLKLWPYPNRAAYPEIAASPSCCPTCAMGMLQLYWIACAIVAVGAEPPQAVLVELWMNEFDPGSWRAAGLGNALSAVNFPLSRAADATTSLN